MSEGLDADEAEGFETQDGEQDDLAPVIPSGRFVCGNLADELDPVLKGQVADLGFECRALPAFPSDDQLPRQVAELVQGVDRDVDALWCEKPGGNEEQAGFGGGFGLLRCPSPAC